MNLKKRLLKFTAAASLAVLLFPGLAAAATVVVTPNNTQGWNTASTTAGGSVNFIVDSTAPSGKGALQLLTDSNPSSKAQYMHSANTPLANATDLSYFTKQVSPSGPVADAAYQLPVFLNGSSGFSTLVFEPYQNTAQGPVLNGVWQQWDVDQGFFWSTRSVTCSNGSIVGTPGGPASYTLAQINSICPSATVIGFGVNIGSNNPSYNVETDLFNFNGTVYDFEPLVGPPTSKDQCKNNGFQSFNNPSFKNQGECISYVNSNGKPNKVNGVLYTNSPKQKIEFDVKRGNNPSNLGDIEYWNFDYQGSTLNYEAKVLCLGGDKSTDEARVMWQIPQGYPGLSGLYVVAYTKEVKNSVGEDLYGHAATSDEATARTWCETGAGYAPTMYQVDRGQVEVE